MVLIVTLPIIFHTVTLNFVVKLLVTDTGFNSMLLITDKFSKRVMLLPEKESYFIKEWASVFLDRIVD